MGMPNFLKVQMRPTARKPGDLPGALAFGGSLICLVSGVVAALSGFQELALWLLIAAFAIEFIGFGVMALLGLLRVRRRQTKR
jgi:hypothetical protein